MSDPNLADGKIIIGKITGVYGVKGWVKVYSWTEPREGIIDYQPWYMKKPSEAAWRKVTLASGKRHGKTVIAKIEGVDDRDAALLLTGQEIAIDESQLKPLGEGEYYWRELIGCRVSNRQGIELGVVDSLMETGANDVLVVLAEDGAQHLIPWAPEHTVLQVDIARQRIEVDWRADWSDNN